MNASVTFETVDAESLADGDFADHGWIAPNEYRVSLGKAGQHAYRKRVRAAQRGRYDWTLSDAVRFILGKAEYVRAEVDIDVHTWEPGRSWFIRVYVERTQEDEGSAESVGYALQVSGLSQGTADRLERYMLERGCKHQNARTYRTRR